MFKKLLNTKFKENSGSLGLLIIRMAAGGLMLIHGYDKLTHFSANANMHIFGGPTDGLLVVFAEVFCALFVMLGLFTRVALLPLIIVMSVAFFKVHGGEIVTKEGHVQESLFYLLMYVGLLFTGPGKYSIDRLIYK